MVTMVRIRYALLVGGGLLASGCTPSLIVGSDTESERWTDADVSPPDSTLADSGRETAIDTGTGLAADSSDATGVDSGRPTEDSGKVWEGSVADALGDSSALVDTFIATDGATAFDADAADGASAVPFLWSYAQNFDNGLTGWMSVDSGAWSAYGGKYQFNAPQGSKSYLANATFSDFVLDVDLVSSTIKNEHAGVMFRATSITAGGVGAFHGYYAGIDGGDRLVVGYGDGTWQLINASPLPSTGAAHHLRMVATGSTLVFFVDHAPTPTLTVVDTRYRAGAIGFLAEGAAASFDNLQVGNGAYRVGFTYENAFGDFEGFVSYGGTWYTNASGCNVDSGDGYKAVLDGFTLSDLTVSADVESKSVGGNAGLVFRVTKPTIGIDSYNGYFAGFEAPDNLLAGSTNGVWSPMPKTPISSGMKHNLKIVAAGTSLKFFVDGALVFNPIDSRFSTGTVGLRSFRTETVFSNLKLTVP